MLPVPAVVRGPADVSVPSPSGLAIIQVAVTAMTSAITAPATSRAGGTRRAGRVGAGGAVVGCRGAVPGGAGAQVPEEAGGRPGPVPGGTVAP